MATEEKSKVGVVWFRNDLRVNDNNALNQAIDMIKKKKIDFVLPFYCFDKDILEGKSRVTNLDRCGPFRRNFLIECVVDLRENLRKINSDLYIKYGNPEAELINLVEEISQNNTVEYVFCNKEIPSEECDLEKRVERSLKAKKINMSLVWDCTMIHLNDLPFSNIDKTPDTFTQLRKIVEIRGQSNYNVRKPVHIEKGYQLPTLKLAEIEKYSQIPEKVVIAPSQRSAIDGLRGGENAAIERTREYFFGSDGLEMYKATRNGLIGKSYSSKLSMWLALGCVSARYLYWKVKEFESKFKANESTSAMVFELLWRDFFKFHTHKYGRRLFFLHGCFTNMKAASYNGYDADWKTDSNLFEKWCQGETGYPFVDANMKEMNETGWMSNRGRQNVASFLTKDLGIDWRYGAEYFEKMLIDYDCTSNWGNWQYVAGVGVDPRADRYFNVIKQAYDYDENGEYVKIWLPNLSKVSIDFVHCPFRMSMLDQRRLNCLIGKDYPEPVVRMKHEWNPNNRRVNKFAQKSKNFKK